MSQAIEVHQQQVGDVDGVPVVRFSMTNAQGMKVSILTYGGIICDLQVPTVGGASHSCVRQLPNLSAYVNDQSYQGALVGRYANRIAGSTFLLPSGEPVSVEANHGKHHLHGGSLGFHKRHWQASLVHEQNAVALYLTLVSADGECGFPGNLNVTALYRLHQHNELSLSLHASTDKVTPFSMTQHAYFTLGGDSVFDQLLMINADKLLEPDADLIPTGSLIDVADTGFDFTRSRPIKEAYAQSHALLQRTAGYDHNYVLRAATKDTPSATVVAPQTGLVMQLFTDLPGLQFYTGNLDDNSLAGALCLEPQHFPDAPNQARFPSPWISPSAPFVANIRYVFSHLKR